MTRRRLAIGLGAALVASCGDTTTSPINALNLNRPIDISFACWGNMRVTGGAAATPDQPIVFTSQPTGSCDTWSLDPGSDTANPANVPPGQETNGQHGAPSDIGQVFAPKWYGFILQSASGTVALSTWPTAPAASFVSNIASATVLDANALTPGKNAISVGEEPVAIATDATGCFEITANAGSCDLSELDIDSAITNAADPEVTVPPTRPVQVTRVPVKNAAGVPILARPAAMVGPPSSKVIGNTCSATPQGLVYIAYPSCHLVAAIDTATATMVAGIKFDATGVRITDGNETCPAECSNGTSVLGAVTPGPRPVAFGLDIGVQSSFNTMPKTRLAIAADKLSKMTIVDLDDMFRPTASILQIPLEDKTGGNLGLTSIAISSVISMGGDTGTNTDDSAKAPPSGPGQYVYAVANDDTVRVADVLNVRHECETQVDARFIRELARNPADVDTLQCLPIGTPAIPRRSTARSPGIELIGDAVPLSVAFMTSPTPPSFNPNDPAGSRLSRSPTNLIGHFAIITASNGSSYVVNVDDDNAPDNYETEVIHSPGAEQLDPLVTSPPLIIPHQLRDAVANRGILATEDASATPPNTSSGQPLCGDSGPGTDASGNPIGGPHATTPPSRALVALLGDPSAPVANDKQTELPFIQQLACVGSDSPTDPNDSTKQLPTPITTLQFAADIDTRIDTFPDIRSLRSTEGWTLTWEGTLSLDVAAAIDGPAVREGQLRVDSDGIHLLDPSKPFCAAGVEPFDTVQLHGCNPSNGNSDCPLGYECFVHPQSQVQGIGACMLITEAERLAAACHDFLVTDRRYTVGRLASGELTLLPRKHVLRTTPIDGCTSTDQCQRLADYALQNASDRDPNTLVDQNGVTTIKDAHKWACMRDDDRAPVNTDAAKNQRCVETCTSSTDCEQGTLCQNGVCMEGVTPPQACVNGPQRFDLRSHDAFTVIGSSSGYVHPFIAQGDKCVRDPAASPVQIGRIPLNPPPCDPMADPVTGALPGGGFEANPCLTTVTHVENQANYSPSPDSACALGNPQILPITRDAPAIQFRNRGMKFNLVDPYYPGDQTCILDHRGTLGPEHVPLVFSGYQISFTQSGGFQPLTLPSVITTLPVKVVRGPTNSMWVIDNGDFLATQLGQASTTGKVYRVESIAVTAFNVLQ